MKRRVSLAQAAAEVGVETIVEQLAAGKLRAFGNPYGPGLPDLIPPEHFTVPLREKIVMTQENRAEAIQAGYDVPSGYAGPIEWVDDEYDGRTGPVLGTLQVPRPDTCLDLEESTIYENGALRWSDIWIEFDVNRAGTKRGPAPKWPWQAIEQFVFDSMDHHGEFSPDDPEWRGVADIERAIQKQYPGSDGSGPSHSTLQDHLPKILERWRVSRRSQ